MDVSLPGPGRLLLALGLGSNEPPAARSPFDLDPPSDPRARALEGALVLLRAEGYVVRATSPLFLTAPHDVDPGEHGAFLNACVIADVPDELDRVLAACERIEREAGRTSKGDGAPRPLDIDLLAGWRARGGGLEPVGAIETAALRLPHPRLAERAFALVPLAGVLADAPLEIAGERVTPWTLLRRLARDPGARVAPGPRSASFPFHGGHSSDDSSEDAC
jgi:2-amino-4-hydroxy-6-hydroxymethyldihydropteridine diphosphokinase